MGQVVQRRSAQAPVGDLVYADRESNTRVCIYILKVSKECETRPQAPLDGLTRRLPSGNPATLTERLVETTLDRIAARGADITGD